MNTLPGSLVNLPLGPLANGAMSSVIALVTGLVKSVPNEEFGVLSSWMVEEGNRRSEHVRSQLTVGCTVVWVNTTKKLTQGVVVEVGTKNAKIRSQHGGELFVSLARLELASVAAARMSSMPPDEAHTVLRPKPPMNTTMPAPPVSEPKKGKRAKKAK